MRPFHKHSTPMQVITAVAFQGERLPPFPPAVLAQPGGEQVQELVAACTREDPADRPTFRSAQRTRR